MKQTLYYGGPILTMEEGPKPQAVMTEGTRIRAVGSLDELRALAPSAGERDLRGRARAERIL